MNKSTQGKLSIFFLLAAVGLLLFVQQPLNEQRTLAEQAHTTLHNEQEEARTTLGELEDHITTMNDLSSTQRINIAKAISDGYHQDDLIEDIITLAEKNYIRVSAVAFTKNEETDFEGLSRDTINMAFTAPNQRQFIRFLETLEDDQRIYRIQQLDVDYQAAVVETSLLIETYHF